MIAEISSVIRKKVGNKIKLPARVILFCCLLFLIFYRAFSGKSTIRMNLTGRDSMKDMIDDFFAFFRAKPSSSTFSRIFPLFSRF